MSLAQKMFYNIDKRTIRSSSLIRSEFLLTSLNELATTGTSSFDSKEHFSANLVLEFPIFVKCYKCELVMKMIIFSKNIEYVLLNEQETMNRKRVIF